METVDAKAKLGSEDALRLARAARTVVAAKGTKVVRFDMREPPDDDTLLAHLLGRSGTLRAPALVAGDTLFVGFPKGGFAELTADG